MLIIPGERDELDVDGQARIYRIRSPLISRTSRYRVLLRLEAIERVLERERPAIIECGDPYQVGWRAIRRGRVRHPGDRLLSLALSRSYLRPLESCRTPYRGAVCPPLAALRARALQPVRPHDRSVARAGDLLRGWGVPQWCTAISAWIPPFSSRPPHARTLYAQNSGIAAGRTLLLYVGRLAQEKNTHTLFAAFGDCARGELSSADRSAMACSGRNCDALRAEAGADVTHLQLLRETARSSRLITARRIFSCIPACRRHSGS